MSVLSQIKSNLVEKKNKLAKSLIKDELKKIEDEHRHELDFREKYIEHLEKFNKELDGVNNELHNEVGFKSKLINYQQAQIVSKIDEIEAQDKAIKSVKELQTKIIKKEQVTEQEFKNMLNNSLELAMKSNENVQNLLIDNLAEIENQKEQIVKQEQAQQQEKVQDKKIEIVQEQSNDEKLEKAVDMVLNAKDKVQQSISNKFSKVAEKASIIKDIYSKHYSKDEQQSKEWQNRIDKMQKTALSMANGGQNSLGSPAIALMMSSMMEMLKENQEMMKKIQQSYEATKEAVETLSILNEMDKVKSQIIEQNQSLRQEMDKVQDLEKEINEINEISLDEQTQEPKEMTASEMFVQAEEQGVQQAQQQNQVKTKELDNGIEM